MDEENYMYIAIQEAKKALEVGEGMAFGAVLVKDGKILGQAHNLVNKDNDPTAHAECRAIREVCKKLQTSNLSGCTLYSTCEPCPMCFTASWWAEVSKIVFGVSLEDVTGVSEEILVSNEYLNQKGGSKIVIKSGLLKYECMKLYEAN